MKVKGGMRKMEVSMEHSGSTVQYILLLDGVRLDMNSFLGKKIKLSWNGIIRCMNCGKITKKSYGQGYCYPCFISIPETDPCILRPELCRAQEGVARNMEWAKNHCLQNHYVYLAISGGLKVGVTRKTQVPTRWIDQGASSAIRIAELSNRFLAGRLEVALKAGFSDKTDWRKMLQGFVPTDVDLFEAREHALRLFPLTHTSYFLPDEEIFEVNYPVTTYPEKVISCNFEREKTVDGVLTGIRGQYLMIDSQRVINLRTFSGYEIELEVLG